MYLFAGAHSTGGLNVTCSLFTHIIDGVFIYLFIYFFSISPTGLMEIGFEGKVTEGSMAKDLARLPLHHTSTPHKQRTKNDCRVR